MKVLSNEDKAQIAIGVKHVCPKCKDALVTFGKAVWAYYSEGVCTACALAHVEDVKRKLNGI